MYQLSCEKIAGQGEWMIQLKLEMASLKAVLIAMLPI
jgi:hypothetical protein